MIARVMPVLGLLALFPLASILDLSTPPPPNVVETLPPAGVLPVLASGHRESFAHLLELRAVDFVLNSLEPGQKFTEEDRDHLFLLYQGMLTLDPDDVGAAIRGEVFLSAFGWRSDASVELLKMVRGEPYEYKGETFQQRSANPAHAKYWRLWYEEGSIYLSLRANEVQGEEERIGWIRRAGEAWVLAHKQGGPQALGVAGERLVRRGLDSAGLLRRELETWQGRLASSPEELRPDIVQRIKALSSLSAAMDLNKHSQVRPILEELARRKQDVPDVRVLGLPFPRESLVPPFGGTYQVIGGKVVCPEAEAFLLEQTLSQTLKRYLEIQPEAHPTLVDLGWLVPPLRPPLSYHPVFQGMAWVPGVSTLKDPDDRLEVAEWWSAAADLPEPPRTLGLAPASYLSYWIDGGLVRVQVR